MAEKGFLLEIVTPENKFYSGNADSIVVRTIVGDVCILRNHEAYVAPLAIGKMRVKIGGEKKLAALSNGYIKVIDNKVTVLTDTAEWADEIDVERAQQAKERAEKRLSNRNAEGLDVKRAEMALKRALTRIDVAKNQ